MLNSKMKIFKSIAVILCLFLIIPSSSIMALNLFPPFPAVNEEATLLAEVLDVYFESRTYTNVSSIIMAISDITNPGMPEDEAVRMQAWQSSNVIGITNSYEIDQVAIGDVLGTATITETVNYICVNSTTTQLVVHYMQFLIDRETADAHILMDSYTEPFINFTSCSYLPEYTMTVYNRSSNYGNDTATNDHVNTGDFAYDVAQIALTQVGYLEKESANSDLDSKTGDAGDGNWTKYNRDIGYNGSAAWCASFVAWCAQEAGLCIGKDESNGYNGTIIPNEKYVPSMANYYKYMEISRYYSASSYTPKIGDIFFMLNKNQTGLGHVGIVVEVDIVNSKVNVVHGNYSDCVMYSSYNLNGTAIVGYASPEYDLYASAVSSHDYQCENHSLTLEHTCNRCARVATATWEGNHTDSLNHTCSLCGESGNANPGAISYAHDHSSHWLTCSICNDVWSSGMHIWLAINGGNDGYTCKICGRHTDQITLNRLLPLIPASE